MTGAKGAAKGKLTNPTNPRTPFERFIDFTRRIVAVSKSETETQERAYKRKRLKDGEHRTL